MVSLCWSFFIITPICKISIFRFFILSYPAVIEKEQAKYISDMVFTPLTVKCLKIPTHFLKINGSHQVKSMFSMVESVEQNTLLLSRLPESWKYITNVSGNMHCIRNRWGFFSMARICSSRIYRLIRPTFFLSRFFFTFNLFNLFYILPLKIDLRFSWKKNITLKIDINSRVATPPLKSSKALFFGKSSWDKELNVHRFF